MNKEKKANSVHMGTVLVIGCAVLGVVLLMMSGGMGKDNEDEQSGPSASLVTYDEREYEAQLIEKISGICSSVRGVGQVSVAVTLDGTYKAVYATDVQSGDALRSQHVLVGSGSSENALLVGYSPPEILGVGIVCRGGDDASVRAEIIALVSAAFDLPTNKIYVSAS